MHYLQWHNFLSEQDCDNVIALGRSRQLERSRGFQLNDGTNKESDYRTSFQVWLRLGENQLIAEIERRIAIATGCPLQNGEALQLAYYPPGTYYKPHYDYFPEEYEGSKVALRRGGQRIITFMIYLNTVPKGGGGETSFVNADISIRPEKGKALIFWNVMPNWQVDSSTYHEGLPPNEGYEKWILNKWIHPERYF